jgi:phosphatidylglycerophosphate synthase
MPASDRPIPAPLGASVVLTGAIGLVAVIGVALAARAGLDVDPWYPVKAAAVFSLIMLTVIGTVVHGHPFARFGPANQVTAVRAMIVALVCGLIGEPSRPLAATSAAMASVVVTLLDGVDGWLARRSRMASVFGARFDMEIDALLIMTLAILAAEYGKAGRWILAAGLIRYLFVASGWVLPWMQSPLPPSRRRQAVCVLQIVGLSLVVLPEVTPPASTWLATVLLASLSYSFLVDVVWLWRHA